MDEHSATTVRDLATVRAQRTRVYDGGSWSAMLTAVVSGVIGFLGWLVYALSLGSSTSAVGPSTFLLLVLAVAIAATVFCAAFSAAYLILRTLQRDAGIDQA